jgi:hypothetical protein
VPVASSESGFSILSIALAGRKSSSLAIVKLPPKSGQSASTKQSIPEMETP